MHRWTNYILWASKLLVLFLLAGLLVATLAGPPRTSDESRRYYGLLNFASPYVFLLHWPNCFIEKPGPQSLWTRYIPSTFAYTCLLWGCIFYFVGFPQGLSAELTGFGEFEFTLLIIFLPILLVLVLWAVIGGLIDKRWSVGSGSTCVTS